jgi:CheY-like chemotaxis protein
MNLCTNAGQAMKDREGLLEVTMWNRQLVPDDLLEYPQLKQGPYLVLSVKDTGCGIAHDNLDRIFEPYFTTKGLGEGTGLGLAVAHGIIKGCEGDIRVYSELGKGTVFHVYLPLSQAVAGQQPQTALEAPRGSECVLFVDDEQTIVDMATVMLEGLGYTVTGIRDPGQALSLFRQVPGAFDIVVTDKTMPGMTGFGFFRELRRIRSDIPVVLCTGYSDKNEQDRAREIGIDGFVLKPVSRQELASVVRDVLDRAGDRKV